MSHTELPTSATNFSVEGDIEMTERATDAHGFGDLNQGNQGKFANMRYPDLKSTSRGTLLSTVNIIAEYFFDSNVGWILSCCHSNIGARLKKILRNKGKVKEEVKGIYERDPNSSIQKHLDSHLVEIKFTIILYLHKHLDLD
ncbi:hypothetical protein MKW98_011158, partial [Papaver atlanticum]